MNGSLRGLINAILSMYDNISIKAIKLIRERTGRIKAEKELLKINEQLKELSITDQLTNLYNRRYFDNTLEKELNKAKRNKTNIGIISIDIDYFKSVNDNYGHAYGDEVLITVASCLKSVCKRPNDLVFRVGGEEFAILITNEDEDNLISLSKIMQNAIKDLKIENKHSKVSNYLTLSGGIISKIPTKDDTNDSIMKLADERLYLAKQFGRDRIIYN